MNPNTGEIVYGDAEVIDRYGKEHGVEMVPVPENVASLLQHMPYGARMAWWRRNRPSLEQLADQPAGLSAGQQKAVAKKARKQRARLARLAQVNCKHSHGEPGQVGCKVCGWEKT